MSKYNRNNSVIPTFMVSDAKKAIEFYKNIFGAVESYRLENNNKIIHAELLIGNTTVMLSDDMPMPNHQKQHETHSKPEHCKQNMGLYIYVNDVDKVFNNAVAAGSKNIFG